MPPGALCDVALKVESPDIRFEINRLGYYRSSAASPKSGPDLEGP